MTATPQTPAQMMADAVQDMFGIPPDCSEDQWAWADDETEESAQ